MSQLNEHKILQLMVYANQKMLNIANHIDI